MIAHYMDCILYRNLKYNHSLFWGHLGSIHVCVTLYDALQNSLIYEQIFVRISRPNQPVYKALCMFLSYFPRRES